MRRLASAALTWMLAALSSFAVPRGRASADRHGAVRLFVMALSWSPGFCDLDGDSKSPRQCAAGAGYGFVVHGLWPDNRFGPYRRIAIPARTSRPRTSPRRMASTRRTASRSTNTASAGPAPASTPPIISRPCAPSTTRS